jgi:hypothetical protein
MPSATPPSRCLLADALEVYVRHVPLEDALKLVYLYTQKDSPKYERAAMKWLRRYSDEKKPTLKEFTKVVRSLEERKPENAEGGL